MKFKKIFLLVLALPLMEACDAKFDSKKVSDKDIENVEIIDTASSKHLAFKGVPIDGTLKQFTTRMKQAGFIERKRLDGTSVLIGDFAGYKNCKVYVSTIDGNDVVSHITVEFPHQDTWEKLYGDYKSLKEMLTEKYGQPSMGKEIFLKKHIADDDDYFRMQGVKDGVNKFESFFTTEKGSIKLWINHVGHESTFVSLQYNDKINGEIVKQQAINDL